MQGQQPHQFPGMMQQPPYWMQRLISLGKLPKAPAMFSQKGSTAPRRIDATSLPRYESQLTAWLCAVYFPGAADLSEALIFLDVAGRVLHIQGHDVTGITDNIPLQRIFLKHLSATCRQTIDMPSPEQIHELPDFMIQYQFRGLSTACQKLWFEFDASSRPSGDNNESVFPDIFNTSHGLISQTSKLGINFLIAIARIRQKLQVNPSGTSFEMAETLYKYIVDRESVPGRFTVFHIEPCLDEIHRQFYAVVAKEPLLHWFANAKTQSLSCQLFVTACHNTSMSGQCSAKLRLALKHMETDFMALSSSRREQISDFNASVRSTLERHLPPAEERAVTDSASQNQLGKRTRTAMETSDSTVMALQAAQVLHDQGYLSKKGLQQVFAGAAMGGAGRPCWRLTSIYRQCVRPA
jgi:hypothetical protein